ncbi:MAG: elongation factor EF-2 [Candidatus Aenigmarchaeota archaeon]|nr:elongation factor EF-2 [Candidatus Aenigmarchaeota archaeon]
MAKKDLKATVIELMKKPEQIRNIGIAAHIDHGKTTLTDNLLYGAGMLSEDLAGTALWTDFDKQEQERGITIYSANVSMVHEFEGKDYLINLIDTPGHVDFGGDVTRAMRAVDGAIIVACAVEGVMPQTETVVRQALKERVKPVLFINKVDRMIKELKLTPEQMQERFMKIIQDVNKLIMKYGEKDFREKWLVNVENGSVAFGSAYRNWAISFPYMKEKNITFKDLIEYCSADKDKELAKKAPIHEVVFDMVIRHLPSPIEAQKYRIEKIWHGDINSKEGQDMVNCRPDGVLSMIITKVIPDPHAGIVATARIFSGTVKKGQMVHLNSQHKDERVQQVSIYKGPQRVQLDEVLPGNIIGIVGLSDAFSGETICSPEHPIESFEAIKHMFEPVVTKSIEPKNPSDLPKLINFLRQTSREDPTLQVSINEETGEYLVSGLGELHIDAKIERPLREKGIDVKTSPPIVVYRESVRAESPEVEGKSPNKHNRFYIIVEPLKREIYDAIAEEKIPEGRVKKPKEMAPLLMEYGMDKEDAKKCLDIFNRNVFIDSTKGIQYLSETMELVLDSFESVCKEGPLSKEPCSGLLVRIVDAKLHEDAIHRGPAQVYPAVRQAIKNAILMAKPAYLEPIQIIRIDAPEELMGAVMSEVQNRRGQVDNVETEQGAAVIIARMPVAEMFGFEASLKSATGGKGFYSLIDVKFEYLPKDLFEKVCLQIRERKGLPKEIPKPEE